MGTPIIFINDPDYIREILVTQASSFVKERTVRRMKILLGEGLITSDDPIHIRQRRIVAPAFHRQRIAAYADEIVSSAATPLRDSGRPGQTIDIAAAMMALSLEIVARTLFDTEVTDDIRRINDEVNTIMGLYNFLVAFPRMENFLHLPIPGIVKFRRSKARLDAVVNRLIAERRADSPRNATPPRSRRPPLHAHPPRSDEDRNSGTVRRPGPRRSPHHLPRRLRNRQPTPSPGPGTSSPKTPKPKPNSTPNSTPSSPQARPTAYPPSPTTQTSATPNKSSPNPCASTRPPGPWAACPPSPSPSAHTDIPPGAHFFFSQYIISRTPEFYPDPLRFDPDRFTPEAKAARPRFTYFPFGAGSRQCIGESFAWMEGVLAIATIASALAHDLSRLRSTSPAGQDHPPPSRPHDDAPLPSINTG